MTLVEPEDGALPYTLEDLPPGPIGVTVEDENGCLSTEAAEIIEPDSLQVEWLFLEDVDAAVIAMGRPLLISAVAQAA